MKRNALSMFVFLVLLVIVAGCSGNGSDPIGVDPETGASSQASVSENTNRVLWGMWQCGMEPGSDRIEIIPLRTAMLTANVNQLLEGQPGNLQIYDLDLTEFETEGRLDCTVTLKHPLPGLDEYNGFDVWGVFLHNGESTINYEDLAYSGGPDEGLNEAVLLNADGYTRWFNWPEFNDGDFMILRYWEGKLSNLTAPTAELNGFKIFADGLDLDDEYYSWITTDGNADDRGIFQAGNTNSRRYQLDFPLFGDIPVVDFQYAIIASWETGDPTLTGDPDIHEADDFPSSANCEEAFFIHPDASANSLYSDGAGDGGGTFRADIEVFDWQGGPVGGNGVLNEIHSLVIDADFIPGGTLTYTQAELGGIASDGTVNSSVFQVELADCTPQDYGETDYWVIVEAAGANGESYDQGFGPPFPPGSRRAAFYRASLNVQQSTAGNTPPNVTGIEDDKVGPGAYDTTVSAADTAITYSAIFTDPDIGKPIHSRGG